MTTIAVKDGVMVSDSQITCGNRVDNISYKKIHNINGNLVGLSGSVKSCLKFIDWFQATQDMAEVKANCPNVQVIDPPEIQEEDFCALVLDTQGNLFEYVGCIPLSIDEGIGSIGSGSNFSLAAMRAGASAKEAVEIACKLDIYSGGDIVVATQEIIEPMTREELSNKTTQEVLDYFLGDADEENKETT
jgi:ATP-dependent protease HslVU (ClpYQ) peptidase subunit